MANNPKMPSYTIKLDRRGVLDNNAISSSEAETILRKVGQNFVATMNKTVPDKISRATGINKRGYKRVRAIMRKALKKGGRRKNSIFWLGENEVHARYALGRFFENDKGAGKGKFFERNAFVLTTKKGKKLLLKRNPTTKKLDHVMIKLHNPEVSFYQGLQEAEGNAEKDLFSQVDKLLEKKAKKAKGKL